VQGATQKPSAYRLICEATEMSFGFDGHPDDEGNIVFTVPSMKKHLTSEEVYQCAVEVLVEGRFFRPIKFDVRFKQPMKCVVESINVKSSKDTPINVVAERKTNVIAKPSTPSPEESFKLSSTRKFLPAVKTGAKPQTLREKVEMKQTLTGLDDKTMEEVAKSTMAKLLAMDSRDKTRK
jgi:hypothetical protein